MKRFLLPILIVMLMFNVACESLSYNPYKRPPQTAPKAHYELVGGLGSVMQNQFFAFVVNKTDLHYEVDGKIPESRDYSILCVNITVVNNRKDAILVGAGDYTLTYGTQPALPLRDITTNQFPLQKELAAGTQVIGDLYFRVPCNAKNFALQYEEVINNDGVLTKGETYTVTLTAKLQEPSERLGEIRKFASLTPYKLAGMSELLKTKTFSFIVNQCEIREDFVELSVTVMTDVKYDANIDFRRGDWTLRYGDGTRETAVCEDDKNYLPELITFKPDYNYKFRLGFKIPEDIDTFVLEYTEDDEDGSIYAVHLENKV